MLDDDDDIINYSHREYFPPHTGRVECIDFLILKRCTTFFLENNSSHGRVSCYADQTN